jgi:hypothetical protein
MRMSSACLYTACMCLVIGQLGLHEVQTMQSMHTCCCSLMNSASVTARKSKSWVQEPVYTALGRAICFSTCLSCRTRHNAAYGYINVTLAVHNTWQHTEHFSGKSGIDQPSGCGIGQNRMVMHNNSLLVASPLNAAEFRYAPLCRACQTACSRRP